MGNWSAKVAFFMGCALSFHAPVALSTVPPENIPPDLRPSLPPVPTGNYWDRIWMALVLLLLALGIYSLIKKLRQKHPEKVIILPSFQQFLRDLHRAKINMGEHNAKHFCSVLCDALKAYLQREYKLPMTCRTTEEFLKLFGKSTKFSWEKISLLSDILQYSDRAKFAGEGLTIDLQRDLFLKACAFARSVRLMNQKPKPTNPTPSKS
jgi:hypothetical protein